MKRQESTKTGARTPAFWLGALLLAVSLHSAAPTYAAVVPGVLPEASADALMVLLPPRTQEAVRRDLASAEAAKKTADADQNSAQKRLKEAQAQVSVCASEIDVIKARVKLAKEQKNQADQDSLEKEVKAKELQLKAIKAREEMRNAEVSLADARRDAAQALVGFLEKELDLIAKRDALVRASVGPEEETDPAALARLETEVRDLERQCIQALKEATEKEKAAIEREIGVLERRLKLHEAQRSLLAFSST